MESVTALPPQEREKNCGLRRPIFVSFQEKRKDEIVKGKKHSFPLNKHFYHNLFLLNFICKYRQINPFITINCPQQPKREKCVIRFFLVVFIL